MRVEFDVVSVPLRVTLNDPVEGMWDRFRIEQVLSNLLTNALRYGQGSAVYVQAGKEGGNAVITVRDEGPGISAADQGHIFQKFRRASDQKEKRGLGLGLHICQSIVERHGGTIDLESTPGRGSIFRLTLPLEDDASTDTSEQASAEDARSHH